MKEWLKLFLLGLGVIAYLIGYGVNLALVMTAVHALVLENFYDENTYYLILYVYMAVGIVILIGMVLYSVFSIDKKHLCDNCKAQQNNLNVKID